MLSKLIVTLSTFALLVAAIPTGTTNVSQCNTSGSPQCCNFVAPYDDPVITELTGVLGVGLSAVDATVGMFCAPIGVLSGGGVQCDQKPVCCQGNQQNGLVNVQCSPLAL